MTNLAIPRQTWNRFRKSKKEESKMKIIPSPQLPDFGWKKISQSVNS